MKIFGGVGCMTSNSQSDCVADF